MSAKQSIFITGLSGFVGSHILRLLAEREEWHDRYSLLQTPAYDLLDRDSLDSCIKSAPDIVLHLAGQTFVPRAFADPAETFQINLLGTLNLLQALKKNSFRGTFLYISSGDVYGLTAPTALPISETALPRPQNPYAVSKIAAEMLCQQWAYTEHWRVIIARPFNHVGAGQSANFVLSNAARQIIRIKHHLQPPELLLGDVDVSRDFLDVEDVIAAYFTLIEHGENHEIYNICSGQEKYVRELIDMMLQLAGVQATIVKDPQRFRPADQQRAVGDNQKLQRIANWQPKPIAATLQALLLDWEQRDLDD